MQPVIEPLPEGFEYPPPDSSSNPSSQQLRVSSQHHSSPQSLNKINTNAPASASASSIHANASSISSLAEKPLPSLPTESASVSQSFGMNQAYSSAPSQPSVQAHPMPLDSNFMPGDSAPVQQTILFSGINSASVISPTESLLGPPSIDLNLNSPITPGASNPPSELAFSSSAVPRNEPSKPFQQNTEVPSNPSDSVQHQATYTHHDRNQSLPNRSTQQYDTEYNQRVSLNRSATISDSSQSNTRISSISSPAMKTPNQASSFQFPSNPQPQQIHQLSTSEVIHNITPLESHRIQENTNVETTGAQFPSSNHYGQIPATLPQFQPPPQQIQGNGSFHFPQQPTVPNVSQPIPQQMHHQQQDPTIGGIEIEIPTLESFNTTSHQQIVIPTSFSPVNIDINPPLSQSPPQKQPIFIPQQNHTAQSSLEIQKTFQFGHGSSQQKHSPSNSAAKNGTSTTNLNGQAPINTNLKSSSEYALHILFTQFVRFAENKLNTCLTPGQVNEPLVEKTIAMGVDAEFDRAISLLGDTARWNPKPVIDSVMFWRKTKSEAFAKAAYVLAQAKASQAKMSSEAVHESKHLEAMSKLRRDEQLAGRRSYFSIYILCRVLTEIVKKTPIEILGEELSSKLEEIVFKQLKAGTPSIIASSPVREASWNLFSELLGEMSQYRFARVGDRFIAELEQYKSVIPKEKELDIQLIIHGMKHLKVKLYPMDALDDSSEFLASLSKFFANTPNFSVKVAYSQVLCDMLLPVAEVATAEFNYPTWANAMESLYDRANDLLSRPKFWIYAYPLATTILSLSPPEAFSKHCHSLFDLHVIRFKDKAFRQVFLVSISRLIWVYLFRCSDSLNNTTKRLDSICRPLIAHGTKKFWTSLEPASAAALTYFIRVVGFGHLTFALENIFFQLIFPYSQPTDYVSLTLDNIYPERTIIAIRAFICTLNDYEINHRPEFPTDENIQSLAKQLPVKKSANPVKAYSITLSEFKEQFSRLIGRLLTLCDANFGHQISGSVEKQQTQNSSFKSQMAAFHFGNNKDHATAAAAQRQTYLELFCILIETIPWCYPTSLGGTRVLELLCRNSVHPNSKVRSTASRVFKNIVTIRDPVTIIPVVTKFLFQIDSQIYSNANVSQGVYSDFKSLIALYVDLLDAWKKHVESSRKQEQEQKQQPAWPPWGHNVANDSNKNGLDDSESNKRGEERKLNNTWNIIEEAEGNGLFFLCSQDREIRKSAIRILRIINEFDQLLRQDESKKKNSHKNSASVLSGASTDGKDNLENNNTSSDKGADTTASNSNDPNDTSLSIYSRIILFFETTEPLTLYKSLPLRLNLSAPERRRIHKLHGRQTGGLVYIAESDYGVDTAIWIKMFPLVMRACFEKFPITVALCRNIICGKLVQMHETVLELSRNYSSSSNSEYSLKHSMHTHSDMVIEQWRMYLIVASTTLTQTDEQKLHVPSNNSSHGRKRSVQKVTVHHQKITSARSVFRMVIPLFDQEHPVIRDAVTTSLAWVNTNIYRTLLVCLEPAFSTWKEEFAFYLAQPRKDLGIWNKIVRVATELFHVLSSTAYFIKDKRIYDDEWILTKLFTFLNEMKSFFLVRPEVQNDHGCHRLRVYFTALLEAFYLGVQQSPHPSRIFSYEMRANYFFFIEEWCGVGRTKNVASQREFLMKKKLMEKNLSQDDSRLALVGFEIEKNSLERQTLSTMSSLCSGPIFTDANAQPNPPGLNSNELLVWIDAVYQSKTEFAVEFANRSLKNLLMANPDEIFIFKEAIASCYRKQSDDPISRNYFLTVCGAMLELNEYPCKIWQILSLGLFKCGDSSVEVRSAALKLLGSIEKRFYHTESVREYEVSLLNNTPAVYKRAMFNLSSRFALEHPSETFMVFSEMTMFFHQVDNFSRRDILAVLLPWIQTVELKLEPDGITPDPSATMVVNNLFEITVIFSLKIQNEVEALWVSIGNGKYPGNVKIVLDFIIHHCLERRSPSFVEHVRKILVYLSSTSVGINLIDDLISYICPKRMVPQKPVPHDISVAASQFPYVSNISTLLDIQEKEVNFSEGQLAVIFLVDILNDRREYLQSNMPLLLHVCYVLMDHYNNIVCTQAREMLITVIHSLATDTKKADKLTSLLRKKDSQSTWSYYELTSDKMGARTPESMNNTICDILEIFASDIPGLRNEWSQVALSWATTCPVRHIACRSFQILRSLLCVLDPKMLGDMLARLSNTIADGSPDLQGFAMQILITFSDITKELPQEDLLGIPQLFWATVACLGTTNEQEFIESINALDAYISRVDLNDRENVDRLITVFPTSKWNGRFDGLQSLLLNGLKSSNAYEPTLRIICKLGYIQNSEIVGQNRLCSLILANMPRFSHALETGNTSLEITEASALLTRLCTEENQLSLARIFTSLEKGRFRSKKDFVSQCASAISSSFFPAFTEPTFKILIGNLLNDISWIKQETLDFLEVLFPFANLHSPEFFNIGADFISPLLRLLQTDYADKALTVLDTVGTIYTNPSDKKVLRISLGDKAVRKEYGRVATVFGIPEPSGWSVISPDNTSAACRDNVHAVFYTCSVSSGEPVSAAEEFQFHQESVPNAPHRVHNHEPTDSLSVPVPGPEGTLSHMYAELSTLDTFFTQTVAPTHARNVSATDTEASDGNDLGDPASQMYDKKLSVILNRSIALSPTESTFKNSLSDSLASNNFSPTSIPKSPFQQYQNQSQIHCPETPSRSEASPNYGLSSPVYQQFPNQQQRTESQSSVSQSDSRYTIGTRFYNHLRRGHASNQSGAMASSSSHNLASPTGNNNMDSGFTKAYRVLSEPSSEAEENLDLYVSRSGPFSINNSGYDVDQYSISTGNSGYVLSSMMPQYSDDPTQLAQSMHNSQQMHGFNIAYPNGMGNSMSSLSGRDGKDDFGSLKSSSTGGNGSNSNLFKLESLLRATTLGKGKKKSEKVNKTLRHKSSMSTPVATSSSGGLGGMGSVSLSMNKSSTGDMMPSSFSKHPPLPLMQMQQYTQEQQHAERSRHKTPSSQSPAGRKFRNASVSSTPMSSSKRHNVGSSGAQYPYYDKNNTNNYRHDQFE